MRRALMVTLLVALTGLLVGSRFYPVITRVEVMGNVHFAKEQVLARAGLAPGDPFLWVTRRGLRRLTDDPWIHSVRVLKHWPDTVALTVYERSPVAYDEGRFYALDGTVLDNVTSKEGLTRIEGWGENRLDEALELVQLLSEYKPEMISYSPGGFEIRLADSQLFTPSLAALQAHWAGFLSQRGQHIAVYPWGVSVKP